LIRARVGVGTLCVELNELNDKHAAAVQMQVAEHHGIALAVLDH